MQKIHLVDMPLPPAYEEMLRGMKSMCKKFRKTLPVESRRDKKQQDVAYLQMLRLLLCCYFHTREDQFRNAVNECPDTPVVDWAVTAIAMEEGRDALEARCDWTVNEGILPGDERHPDNRLGNKTLPKYIANLPPADRQEAMRDFVLARAKERDLTVTTNHPDFNGAANETAAQSGATVH